MKKLFLSLAVVMSVSLFSCGNGNNGEATDSVPADSVEAVAVEETVVEEVAPVADSAAEAPADTTVAAQA